MKLMKETRFIPHVRGKQAADSFITKFRNRTKSIHLTLSLNNNLCHKTQNIEKQNILVNLFQ